MIDIKNPCDPTDPEALGPSAGLTIMSNTKEYNRPGLPKPPEGWGKPLPVSTWPAEMCR